MNFVFKRALIRPEETWMLEGTRLSGPDVALDLGDVSSCNFDYTILKHGQTASELKLVTNGKVTTLDCVGKTGTVHRDTFLGLALEILRAIRLQNPDLKVTSKGTDVLAWGFAAIGAASALWGIYFAASHFSDNDPGFAMGVGAVMVLLGAFCIWAGSPWKANTPKSLTEAVEWVERLRAL